MQTSHNSYLVSGASFVTAVNMYDFLRGFGFTEELSRNITAQIGSDNVMSLLDVDPHELPLRRWQKDKLQFSKTALKRGLDAGKTVDHVIQEQIQSAQTNERRIREWCRDI